MTTLSPISDRLKMLDEELDSIEKIGETRQAHDEARKVLGQLALPDGVCRTVIAYAMPFKEGVVGYAIYSGEGASQAFLAAIGASQLNASYTHSLEKRAQALVKHVLQKLSTQFSEQPIDELFRRIKPNSHFALSQDECRTAAQIVGLAVEDTTGLSQQQLAQVEDDNVDDDDDDADLYSDDAVVPPQAAPDWAAAAQQQPAENNGGEDDLYNI